MKPKSRTVLPLWLLPAVGLGFGLAVSAIGLVPLWLTTSGAKNPSVPRPIVVKPPSPLPSQPVKPQAPAAKPAPAPSAADRDAAEYAREIANLREEARFEINASKQMLDAGGISQSQRYIDDARHHSAMATCMQNQLERKIPLYQGKATCATAVSADR